MTSHITLRSPSIRHGLPTALRHCVLSFLLALWLGASWHTLLAQASAAPKAQADQDARPLVVGQSIERKLASGQSHLYKITLAAGQYLNAVVEQRGIDVVVTLFGPDGKQLIEIDSPRGAQGLEPVLWIVETGGDYRLAVRPLEKDAATGRYEIKIIELRPATEQDRARKLLNESVSLWERGKYTEAIQLAERALVIREKSLGPEHPDVATSLNNLAELYRTKGDYAKAEPLLQRALAIWEKALGPEHPDVANSLNNFALLYYAKGDHAKAEPLFQRALAIREKSLGPEHPNVANSLNSLAGLYYTKGDYAKAEPLLQRALAIREKALGPEHPDVATSLNNLAELWRNKGDYAKAEPLYQRALAIWEKALGPEHPNVATSLYNLAELYRTKGDHAKAEPLYQRALAIREKALGRKK
jgi:tetratricopeptide (TPR) repeat protein